MQKIFHQMTLVFKLVGMLFFIAQPNISFALYDDCIFSWEFGDAEREIIVVRPIGEICYERCKRECDAFSRTGLGGELNQDRIDACYMTCQSGSNYIATVRDPNPDATAIKPFVETAPITVPVSCSPNQNNIDSAYNNYYNSGLEAGSGEKVYITLVNPPGFAGNVIYMCGKKSTKIYPNYFSLNSGNWSSNSGAWSYRNFDPSTWNVRNPHWTDTGIDAKNGDEISITYGWEYHYGCSSSACSANLADYRLLFRPPYNESWDNGTHWELPGDSIWTVEGDEYGNYSVSPEQARIHNDTVSFLGLTGRAWYDKRKVSIDSMSNPIPTVVDNYKYRMHRFYGWLTGFSARPSRVGVMHYDGSYNRSVWDDNLGGATVEVNWKGCPYYQGDRLQYALVPATENDHDKQYNPKDPSVTWRDIPLSVIQNRELFTLDGPSGGGAIFFRIKPLPYSIVYAPSCPSVESVCQNSIIQVINNFQVPKTSGQYFIEVQKENTKGMVSTFVSDIINQVRSYLFGNSTEEGKVQKIFNMMVVDTVLIDTVRAVLVLFVAYTGLSFLIGTAQITQQEAIVRLMKFSIVTILISPDSWRFFNTYLFNFFTNGGLELIARVSAPTDASSEYLELIEQDPSLIFSMFDKPFAQLFAREVWIKILALILSNFIGFFVAIVIMLAAVIYAVSIGKAILVYLISLVGIAILLLLAPIFISCILFQYTRQLFDAWIKQLLSFVLQPVFVFGILAILNNLLLIGLYTCLNFTACKICLLGFNLQPLFDICLIPAWTTMMDMHYPPQDFIGMPISLIGAVLFFLIIAQATYVMCDYCSQLAIILATGSFFGMDLASVATRTPGALIGGVTEMFGMDEKSNQFRAGAYSSIKQFGASRKDAFTAARDKAAGKQTASTGGKGFDSSAKPTPPKGGTPPPGNNPPGN